MSILTKQISAPRMPSLRRPSGSLRRSSGSAQAVTGLEIGATQVIAAQARAEHGRILAERVVARDLPLGLMRDGLVLDPARLTAELKELFAEHRLSKRVRVGLATPRTVLRVIDLPPLDERDIRTALMVQAQERIPMPLESAVLDHQPIGLVDTPDGQRMRVVVVATERDGVDRLLEVLRLAGLKPEGIDLSIFAVIRALGGDRTQGPVLFAQLGDLVNIAISESGVCRFTRQAPQGLAVVLERVAESLAIPTDDALAMVRRLAATGADLEPSEQSRDVTDLLSRTAAELGSELRAASEFYANQFGTAAVTSGVVAGPLAPLPGFVAALSRASGLELTCGEVATAAPDALGAVDARLAPVASGLAVARVGA